jgi:hypothetical protein
VKLAIEDFASYRAVDSFADLTGPGSRLLRLPAEWMPHAPMTIAGGQPTLRFDDGVTTPVELRCAKVARALCLRPGLIIDLDTQRVLPDIVRKPPPVPERVDVDLSPLGIGDSAVDWESVPAQTEPGPGLYADSWYVGYGHALLEGLSRCWALGHIERPSGVVVAHKAARSIYRPWFEALGVPAGELRSAHRAPLRVDNLLVPSQSYVLDRGMSPRFHELTRRIAKRLGAASGCARLYVSRRDAPKRRLVNEAEIEAVFSEGGFRIYHPEEHTIEEQVRAFAGASVVAGPVGSSLYSVAFSPPQTRLLVLAPNDFYTPNDQILAAARDQGPAYAFGDDEREPGNTMLADWHLDPALARVALERVLGDGPPQTAAGGPDGAEAPQPPPASPPRRRSEAEVAARSLSYLEETGWLESHRSQSSVDADGKPIPWYRYAAIDFLAERVGGEHRVFEFGSGNSTLWWASHAGSVTTIEHDSHWAAQAREGIPENVTLLEVPLDSDGRYCRSASNTGSKYEIVVIDGRDRVNCARQALNALTDDGVIVWDDSQRRRYRGGIELLVSRGFRRLRFTGLGPIAGNGGETSVLYRPTNCLGI